MAQVILMGLEDETKKKEEKEEENKKDNANEILRNNTNSRKHTVVMTLAIHIR